MSTADAPAASPQPAGASPPSPTAALSEPMLREVMDDSFVLLLAHWPAQRARTHLRGLRVSHVVVLREAGERRFHYLYRLIEIQERLADAPAEVLLVDWLQLHEYTSTETRDAASRADQAPDVSVALDGERVVGFLDAREMPGASLEVRLGHELGAGPVVVFAPRPTPVEGPAPRRGGRGSGGSRGAAGTGSKASAAAPAAPPFSAFPAVSAPARAEVSVPFDLFVGFRALADASLDFGAEITIAAPEPGKDCLVTLMADGLTLDRDHDFVPLRRNALIQFTGTLKAGVQRATLKVLFIHDQRVIGTAQRSIEAETVSVPVPAPAPQPPAAPPAVPGVSRRRCPASLPQAETAVDVCVFLNHQVRDGTLAWRILAPGYPGELELQPLRSRLADSKAFAAELMRDLGALKFRGPFARNVLETIGQQITSLMPPELFDVLQTVQAQQPGRPPTLLLVTDETLVPWELAYLAQPLDPAAPPFLGAQTSMGRWLEDENVALPPAVALQVRRFSAVAAEYGLASGQPKLPEALAEQQALCNDWDGVPLDATLQGLQPLVTGARIAGHLVHFSVHGYSDPLQNSQSLLLADKSQLPASALTAAYQCGDLPRFGFVFLNACQVGTPGRSLGQAGGFPGFLVRAGTQGFIAPLWDVDDGVARQLAESFYHQAFEEGLPVGAALRASRGGYDNGSTTPLAYIYYGHPGLRLSRPCAV